VWRMLGGAASTGSSPKLAADRRPARRRSCSTARRVISSDKYRMKLQVSAPATRREILLEDDPMIWLPSKPEARLATQARKKERPASPSGAETMATIWTCDNGCPIPALGSEAAQTDPLLRSNRKGCATLRAGKDEALHGSPRSHGTTLPRFLLPSLPLCDESRNTSTRGLGKTAGPRVANKRQVSRVSPEHRLAMLGDALMSGQDLMGRAHRRRILACHGPPCRIR
jgi:hypothetical protein